MSNTKRHKRKRLDELHRKLLTIGYEIPFAVMYFELLEYAKTAPQLTDEELAHLIVSLLIQNQRLAREPSDSAQMVESAIDLVYAEREARILNKRDRRRWRLIEMRAALEQFSPSEKTYKRLRKIEKQLAAYGEH